MNSTARTEKDWTAFLQQHGLVPDGEHSDLTGETTTADGWIASLDTLGCVTVSGKDAESFLDGQLSAPVRELDPHQTLLTAWHDPKGRARTLLHLWRDGDDFRLLMPAELLTGILPKLRMYILRSQVSLMDHGEEWRVLGLRSASPPGDGQWRPLRGAADFYYWAGEDADARERWLASLAAGHKPLGKQEWRWLEMQADIPALPAAASELFLPQFMQLERFGGLSFRKGCYIGQEVIARTHYLGKVKQGLHLATCPTETTAGTAVRNQDDRRIGHTLDAVQDWRSQSAWLVQLVIREPEPGDQLYLDQEGRPPLELSTPLFQEKSRDTQGKR